MSRRKLSVHRTWDRVRTVPGLGRDISALAVFLLIGLVVTGLLLVQTRFTAPWEDRYVFSAEFGQAPAVSPESSHTVTIAGVVVGKISDWEITERGTARLEFAVDPKHQIYDNAHAVLRADNPLNEMHVEINPGGPPGNRLPDNGVIPASQTTRPIQADEVLEHLDERARLALTALLAESDVALARAPQELPGGLRATDDVLVGFQPAVDALETRRDKLAQLVTALARISAAAGDNHERIARLADATQQTLNVLATNDEDLRASMAQLPGLNDELRKAFTSTQQLTVQLDPTLDNLNRASEELPPALRRISDTAGELGTVVDAARPVVSKAQPVVADLRPLVGDVDAALDDALPVTRNLDRYTSILVSHLGDLQAFVYNTSSVFSVEDARGGIIRANVTAPDGLVGDDGGIDPEEGTADDGLVPDDEGGN